MNWFLIALIAPFLWALSNHIDKYLLNKYFKDGGAGALVIFSALIGVPLLPIIYLLDNTVFSVTPLLASLVAINGSLFVIGLIPYMHALDEDETSIVTPLYQTIPIFGYVLAFFFLGETLTTIQIVASLLIISGAILLSLDLDKKFKLKKKVFWLMMLSAFLIALNSFFFKFIAIKESFLLTSFWEYIGFPILSIILLVFVKNYRAQFFNVLKVNTTGVLTINIFNEIINIVAKIIINFTTLLAPLALVWVVNGIQPLFVLVMGIIITLFFPRLGKESLHKKHLIQKIISILIMIIGISLL